MDHNKHVTSQHQDFNVYFNWNYSHSNTTNLLPHGTSKDCDSKEPHKEVTHSIFLCSTAGSTLHVPFPIDFSCAISKVFLIENFHHD